MKKIKIITDSTAYMTREEVEKFGVSVVPLSYVVDNELYREGYPSEFEDFFNRMKAEEITVTTSQPAVGDFLAEYERAFSEAYEEIIVLVLSSKLSGAYNSANLAKATLGDKMITVIDSKTAGGNLKFLVMDAVRMAEEGKTSLEIVDFIENKREDLKLYLLVADLKYLSRGGRISKFGSLVGNLLNVKPIIEISNGELNLINKARGKKQALSLIAKNIPEDVKKISICNILAYEDSKKYREKLMEKFPKAEITIEELGPVVGGHLGPDAMGICIYI